MRRARFGAAIAMAGAFVLTGCGFFGSKETKLVCPVSFVAPDTDKEAVFKPGGTTLNDVRYGVQITGINSKCQRADKGLIVDTQVRFFLIANDPSMRAGSFDYFVSVVDGQQNILTKQDYTMPFEFDPRQRSMERQDELIENLPLFNPGTGGNYAILVGLQLTPAQFEFNRASNRRPTIAVAPGVPVSASPPGPSATPKP
jgi:hypothetical protein